MAAQVPQEGFGKVESVAGDGALKRDEPVTLPKNVFPFGGRQQLASSTTDLTPAGLGPADNILATFVRNIGKESSVQKFAKGHAGSYLLNHAKSNVRELHEKGYTGKDVIVAVIDTGLRPGYEHLREGTVIGCEDLLPTTGQSANSSKSDKSDKSSKSKKGPRFDDACLNDANSGHGTFVAGLIAGNAIFQFDLAGTFLQSVGIHAPSVIFSDDDKSDKSGKSGKSGKDDPPPPDLVAMIGSAPNAKIYALRVFDNDGLRGNSQDILAAVERVIELKNEHGVDIEVVNMSFGRRTFFAGQDLFQLTIDALLDNDILPVVAVGNSGPSSVTTASPASSIETMAVAAGSVPHQERIVADVFFGFPGLGNALRPFDGTQTASFSSRGPNADGRTGPDVIGPGFGLFSQGLSDPAQDPTNDRVSMANGTSFSTPLTTGIAAVLRGKYKGRSARQVRNAIIESANPSILEDGSTAMDRGSGWVDAKKASDLLKGNKVYGLTPIPATPSTFVRDNLEFGTGLTVQSGVVNESTGLLLPGERHEIFYEIPPNTAEVTVRIHDVDAENPPAGQNPFFGDSIMLSTHSAKTSSIVTGDYFDLNASPESVSSFIGEGGDRTYVLADFDFDASGVPPSHLVVFDNLEPGILRITVGADPLNLGRISTDVTITSSLIPRPGLTASGNVAQGPLVFDQDAFEVLDLGNSQVVTVPIPAFTGETEIRLEWDRDWSRYPTDDLDVFVELFGFVFFAGFTLDSPEVITIPAGFFPPFDVSINVIVSGFEVNSGAASWRLRVTTGATVLPEL